MLKITACAIMKNEENNFPRWIKCATALASDIVVVDTGSTDRTVELAQSAGARVFFYQWNQNFAAAKNFAIQKAKGDWIAFLDADEYFSTVDIPKVKAHIQTFDKQANIAGFVCPWINIDIDNNNMVLGKSVQLRIFRRHPDIRYQGAIHEMLKAHGRNWQTPSVNDVQIWHTGYTSRFIHNKVLRNLNILKKEMDRRGEIPSDAVYLADCYFGLNRYEEAIHWAQKAIKAGVILVGLETRPYEVLLGSISSLHCPPSELYEAALDAQKAFPEVPNFKAYEGNSLWNEKDYIKAETVFKDALALTSKGDGQIRASILGFLARISHLRNRDAEALEYGVEALQESRYNALNFSQVCLILKELPPVDVIQFLNTIYDPSEDAQFLIKNLSDNELYEICLYYDKKSEGRYLSGRDRLFFARAYPAAVHEEARLMTRRCAMALLAARRTGNTAQADANLPEIFQSSNLNEETAISAELNTYLQKLEQIYPVKPDNPVSAS